MSEAESFEVLRFGSVDERAQAIADLVRIDAELERWSSVAALEDIPDGLMVGLPMLGMAPGDSRELRLRRWASVFQQEIMAVRDTRNRVVHGVWVSDGDIIQSLRIGNRVLDLLQTPRDVPAGPTPG